MGIERDEAERLTVNLLHAVAVWRAAERRMRDSSPRDRHWPGAARDHEQACANLLAAFEDVERHAPGIGEVNLWT